MIQPLRQTQTTTISATHRRNSNDGSLRTKYHQEKYPPSKKEKRILKQRSQDSLGARDLSNATPSQSPLRCQSEILPSPPETPRPHLRPERHSAIETGNVDSLQAEIIRSKCSVASDKDVSKAESLVIEETSLPTEETNVQSQDHQVELSRMFNVIMYDKLHLRLTKSVLKN